MRCLQFDISHLCDIIQSNLIWFPGPWLEWSIRLNLNYVYVRNSLWTHQFEKLILHNAYLEAHLLHLKFKKILQTKECLSWNSCKKNCIRFRLKSWVFSWAKRSWFLVFRDKYFSWPSNKSRHVIVFVEEVLPFIWEDNCCYVARILKSIFNSKSSSSSSAFGGTSCAERSSWIVDDSPNVQSVALYSTDPLPPIPTNFHSLRTPLCSALLWNFYSAAAALLCNLNNQLTLPSCASGENSCLQSLPNKLGYCIIQS